ncbi:uncharacterized protein LOC121877338 [Homarus americanus]|uniref:uncharacterized protein LOC121877338 n=1 Tax=Homarus americanus TaxID=6706 RepID=UPI001C469979|nr:uncharacterized protein LOC121877338 [Homarus americanus]
MSINEKRSVEEQLALYRLQKKKEEARKCVKRRLWNFLYSIMTLGASKDTFLPSSSSCVTDDKSDISSEEPDIPNSSKVIGSKGTRKRVLLRNDGSSGMSTDDSEVNLHDTTSRFYENYTTLDWVAMGLKSMMWLLLFKVFILIEFGAVFFIFSAFALMWYNLRSEPKKKGEISAYSVFNPNCEAIEGTFTAEQFERELLHKM